MKMEIKISLANAECSETACKFRFKNFCNYKAFYVAASLTD